MPPCDTTARRDAIIDGLPAISGTGCELPSAATSCKPVFLPETDVDPTEIRAACALALHMHQPTVPAGGDDLGTADLIGHLQYMLEHPDQGDNHNANTFAWCYQRMGEFIRQLLDEGKSPRIMLDYSGELLWGLEQMGRSDVLELLATITCDGRYRRCTEWLGTMWGHAVASSTPPADIVLHLRAWQEHFAAIFGAEALARVRGFSPPEMHLPNDPDVAYAYVKALLDCGYTWLLVQEHTVENLDGSGLRHPHLPHRLVARNSAGETVAITALVKTQGSDTKLVAQLQPLAEAQTLNRQTLGGVEIPPCVTQIGDGENGGVMMNEFPRDYCARVRNLSREGVVLLNGTEHLEFVEASGVKPEDFLPIQPIHQHAIWSRVEGNGDPDRKHPTQGSQSLGLQNAIASARRDVPNFHLDGGSWTNDISWVAGYEGVLDPMHHLSAEFHRLLDQHPAADSTHAYRNALLHLLASQTSCYRYWGQGRWTDYAQEICRRGMEILGANF
ncbi:MAG: glycosyl hydrolase family 57 [bacterium]|nr:glycosyl hydrolase family 57 [bacterium]